MAYVHAVLDGKNHIVFRDRSWVVQDWVIKNQANLPDDYVVLVDELRTVFTIDKYVELSTPVQPAQQPEVKINEYEELRETLSSMTCVQAGWAFGVPEDGRDQWLDLVVKAVMEKYS